MLLGTELFGVQYVNFMGPPRGSFPLLTGAVAVAEDYVDYLQERLDWVSSRVSDIPEEERTTIAHGSSIYELDFDGANTIIDQWITYAGGINAAAEGLEGNLQTITMEQVLEWDPDVLITGRPQSQVDEANAVR